MTCRIVVTFLVTTAVAAPRLAVANIAPFRTRLSKDQRRTRGYQRISHAEGVREQEVPRWRQYDDHLNRVRKRASF